MRAESAVPVGLRSRRPGGHDNGIAGHPIDALERAGELHDADAADLGNLWMHGAKLLACRVPKLLAHDRDVLGLVDRDREPEDGRVNDGVDHSTVRDVHFDRAEAFYFDGRVEAKHEARDVLELHRLDDPTAASGADADDTAGHVEVQDGLWLGHRNHPCLQEDRGDADRVRARHGGILGGLHDDGTRVAIGPRGRNDEVHVAGDASPRLEEEQLADVIVVPLHCPALVEHRGAGGRKDAAGDDIADLACGVAAHHGDDSLGFHRKSSEW